MHPESKSGRASPYRAEKGKGIPGGVEWKREVFYGLQSVAVGCSEVSSGVKTVLDRNSVLVDQDMRT